MQGLLYTLQKFIARFFIENEGLKYMTDMNTIRCTMCGRRIKVKSQLDMPIFDPSSGFAVCKSCIKEINRYIEEDEQNNSIKTKESFNDNLGTLLAKNKPHVIKKYLDEFII